MSGTSEGGKSRESSSISRKSVQWGDTAGSAEAVASKAWSDKDAERLVAFYTPDTVYRDPQTTDGLAGRTALKNYLKTLFASTPPMIYTPDTVWGIEGGFCGRWC